MKLCNIAVNGEIHLGIVKEKGVVDATAAGFGPDMERVISGEGMEELRRMEAESGLPLIEAPEYANVLSRPGKLLCVGLNYRAHAQGVNMQEPDCLLYTSNPTIIFFWHAKRDSNPRPTA